MFQSAECSNLCGCWLPYSLYAYAGAYVDAYAVDLLNINKMFKGIKNLYKCFLTKLNSYGNNLEFTNLNN